jgi:hypothetical protein
MKKILNLFLLGIVLLFSSCSKDDGKDNNPLNPGVGGEGNVSFTVALAQDDQQNLFFEFTPSTNVVISSMSAQCQALNLNETVTDEEIPDDIFGPQQPLYVGPLTVDLQQGQQWSFTMQGKIGSATGQAFNASANFTVQ